MGAHDMITGQDILSFLRIDILFSEQLVRWEGREMPFKPVDASIATDNHVKEAMAAAEAADRIKSILDAKCEAADLSEACKGQSHLNAEQQGSLLTLLHKYKTLFDGTLGKWTMDPVDIELKEDATPYHARPYPIPKCP